MSNCKECSGRGSIRPFGLPKQKCDACHGSGVD